MAKKFPAHRIKTHRIYTVWEVSDILGCHKQTIVRWIRHNGLSAETNGKPWLIEGCDLKTFLGARQRVARCKLASHYRYCLGCKEPREPDGKIADCQRQTPTTKQLIGLCPACGALMHKVVKRTDLETIRTKIEVTVQQVNPRLVSRADPPSNVTFNKEVRSDGKAQQG